MKININGKVFDTSEYDNWSIDRIGKHVYVYASTGLTSFRLGPFDEKEDGSLVQSEDKVSMLPFALMKGDTQ